MPHEKKKKLASFVWKPEANIIMKSNDKIVGANDWLKKRKK